MKKNPINSLFFNRTQVKKVFDAENEMRSRMKDQDFSKYMKQFE